MNHLLVEDFDYICNRDIEWNAFNGKTFLVTGATGLIGSLFIKAVLYASQKYDLDIKIIALIRDIKRQSLYSGQIILLSLLLSIYLMINWYWKIMSIIFYMLHR